MATKNNFSYLKDTWSDDSNLKMDNWQPYPEFQNSLNNYNSCFQKENYLNVKKMDYSSLDRTWMIQDSFTLN